jgi:hypothetical protein
VPLRNYLSKKKNPHVTILSKGGKKTVTGLSQIAVGVSLILSQCFISANLSVLELHKENKKCMCVCVCIYIYVCVGMFVYIYIYM